MTAASFVKNVRGPPILATDKWGKMLRREKVMKILIFTCLCQRATHCRNVALHPLQMLLVLPAAHNEGKDVFLQLKAWHNITLLPGWIEQKMRKRQGHLDLAVDGQRHYFIGLLPHCLKCLIRRMHLCGSVQASDRGMCTHLVLKPLVDYKMNLHF